MAKGKRFFNKRYIVVVGHEKDWTPTAISKRINNNGGNHQSKINRDTTHLVATSKAWKRQGGLVKDALVLNDDKDNNRSTEQKHRINIVTFDWLDDSWRGEKTKHEDPYRWEKIDPKAMQKGDDTDEEDSSDEQSSNSEPTKTKKKTNGKPNGKAKAKANGKRVQVVDGPKSHKGLMAQVFQESTDKYVNQAEAAAIKRKQEYERRIADQLAEEERKEKEEKKKAAAAFKKGAKKCRNEIFSENHHIYTDDTGFKYDVLLTKVDTRHNRNERWALTIYESNSEPYTYAMNAHFAGTATRPENNVMAAIGSSIFVAFHAFKTAFKEKTGVDWDSRISFHLERQKREKRNRGQGTGSDHGTQRGVPVSENGAGNSKSGVQEDFETAPFQYHPPQYGAKGTLSEEEKAKLQEAGSADCAQPAVNRKGKEKAKDYDKVNEWMNGGSAAERASDFEMMGSMFPNEDLGEDGDFAKDMDKILLTGLPRGVGNVKSPEDTGFEVDSDGAFDYPFDQDNIDWQDLTDVNNPSQEPSFNFANGIPDSFQAGTQHIGETQLAEQVHGECMEHFDKPDGQEYGDIDLPMVDEDNDGEDRNGRFDQPEEIEQKIGIDTTKLDLGSSILGKRKSSSDKDAPSPKKVKPAEVPDSFEGEPDVLDDSDSRADEQLSRSFMDQLAESADVANAQLLGDMAAE